MNYPGRGSPRRRRSRRRRQIRRMRIALSTLAFLVLATVGWLFLDRTHSYSPDQASVDWPTSSVAHHAIRRPPARNLRVADLPHYPIYNYSVVRGGVHSVEELRRAIAHDHAVAEHYAKFQYDHARLVRLRKPALVYLSYRMNDKIYWTRTPHRLNAGEELITDGTMAARTKCANQISAKKQLAVSDEEPPAAVLEQIDPGPLLPPVETRFPALYKTALVTPAGPTPWVGPPIPLGGLPIFAPPAPGGGHGHGLVCEPEWKERQEDKLGIHDDESKEKPCPHRPHKPPAAVPEPGSILLTVSGLAIVFAVYRKRILATKPA